MQHTNDGPNMSKAKYAKRKEGTILYQFLHKTLW